MRRLGTLLLPTALLLATPFAANATQSGGGASAGSGHAAGSGQGATPSWDETVIDADQSFRGLDAVNRRTAWVAGGSIPPDGPAKVFRTTDGGQTWQDVSPPDTAGLAFRDVEARSATNAVVLAIGPGDASRIYRTTDGGSTWDTVFVNDDPAAFYDCMGFFSRAVGAVWP